MTTKVDHNPYIPENVPLFEMLYGKNLISLGGLSAIENMFNDLNIDGKHALDVGFGLGGVAFYLAKVHGMSVSGVELYRWMVDYANQHKPDDVAAKLQFTVYDDNGDIPFADHSFDLVYSKGVLNHVKDKLPLFRQVAKLMKPGAEFVIADWIYPDVRVEKDSPLVFETQQTYRSALGQAGFENIQFRDDSQQFQTYVESFLKNLENERVNIGKEFGEEVCVIIQRQHEALLGEIQQQQKIATRIVAVR